MSRKKAPATAAENRYLDAIAQLPCVLCGARGVQLHHVRAGQGMGQRAGHYCVVALCEPCHTGSNGLHGNRSLLRIQKVEEMDLLDRTIAAFAARYLH